MAGTVKDFLTFIGGINTEASPLSFPENASLDELNCVLYPDGSRQRRLGLDLEDAAVWNTVTSVSGFRWNSMVWEGAGGIAAKRFIVVQAGSRLFFFDGSDGSYSNKLKYVYTFPEPSPITIGLRVEGVSALGDFVVTTAGLPAVFRYLPATDTIVVNFIQIRVRDVFGVSDGLAVDENPTTLSIEHKYNLLNQGWSKRDVSTPHSSNIVDTINPPSGSVIFTTQQQTLDPAYITKFFSSTGYYPDNTQIWWAGKKADDTFGPAKLEAVDFGTTQAPRGRVLIDAFNRGTTRRAAFTGSNVLPEDRETGRPTTVCFAFQRVWYSGITSEVIGGDANSPKMTGFLFFTRTIRNFFDLGMCYNEADPCSEFASDPVDTDGGFINIPDSGQIYSVVSVGEAVIVLAQFGVWVIQGGQEGFTSTNFVVSKVSSVGVSSTEATVVAGSTVFYWGFSGIHRISQSSSGWVAENISEPTIQKLLYSIPQTTLPYVTGVYDSIAKRVRWLINVNEKAVSNFVECYDNELVLDLQLGAFYRYSYLTNTPDVFVAGHSISQTFLEIPPQHQARIGEVVKYLIVVERSDGTFSFTFGYNRSSTFTDLPSIAADAYVSYLETGWDTSGYPAHSKWMPYVITYFRRLESEMIDGQYDWPCGCNIQTRWDWTSSAAANRWGPEFNAYRLLNYAITGENAPLDYGYDVITTKNRISGTGKALSIRFSSLPGKDFHLYGWSLPVSANPSP